MVRSDLIKVPFLTQTKNTSYYLFCVLLGNVLRPAVKAFVLTFLLILSKSFLCLLWRKTGVKRLYWKELCSPFNPSKQLYLLENLPMLEHQLSATWTSVYYTALEKEKKFQTYAKPEALLFLI